MYVLRCGAALSQLLLLRGAAVGQHLECGLALGMGERSACGAERESLRPAQWIDHNYAPQRTTIDQISSLPTANGT